MFVLPKKDFLIDGIIKAEENRLRKSLVLIASENYASAAVLEATGSVLTNKYAEGYPGNRYYAGTEQVDEAEKLAISRGKKLFLADHINVQPHSGSQANMAAYFAILKPGDRVLAMSLNHGGHLTHGSKVNFSGKLFEFEHYGVDPSSEYLDYDDIKILAKKFMPKLIVAGYTAYPRFVDFSKFRDIADEVDAALMADMSHIAGLVAADVHPSPIPYADITTSTTHKTLRGPRGAMALTKNAFSRRYDSAVFPNTQGGPMMHSIAAKAVAFNEAMRPEFRIYANDVIQNARTLAGALESGGLRLVSGGTDNHLMLIDLMAKGLTGKNAEQMLQKAGIIVNKNTIPNDLQSPMVTSGIRIGTAAVTSRGMNVADMEVIAGFIIEALEPSNDDKDLSKINGRVSEFASNFKLPGVDDRNSTEKY